jgi:hypothetical protein
MSSYIGVPGRLVPRIREVFNEVVGIGGRLRRMTPFIMTMQRFKFQIWFEHCSLKQYRLQWIIILKQYTFIIYKLPGTAYELDVDSILCATVKFVCIFNR